MHRYTSPLIFINLTFFCNFFDEAFGVVPSDAWIGDGLAVGAVVGDFLAAFDEVAFDHDSFDEFFEIGVVVSAVQDFADNADLFFVLFV